MRRMRFISILRGRSSLITYGAATAKSRAMANGPVGKLRRGSLSFLDTLFGQSGTSANLAPPPGGPPDYAALNPDAGNTAALEKLLTPPDPYAEFDKKRKEEAEKQAAMGGLWFWRFSGSGCWH